MKFSLDIMNVQKKGHFFLRHGGCFQIHHRSLVHVDGEYGSIVK
jgi:hypothetical protein